MNTLQSKHQLCTDFFLKVITVLVFWVLINHHVNAQNECGTPASVPPSWFFNPSLKSTALANSSYYLNIYVHIVQSSSGAGLGAAVADNMLSLLNSSYSGTGIQFNLLGVDLIKNDAYYISLSYSEQQALFNVNSHSEAIDIYVLGESTDWGYAGLAQGIPGTALIVAPPFHTQSTLSHEMGHCLGLYHTHHGTVRETGGDGNQCSEYVDGSNSSTCGDYISDTPADPNIWSGCTYVGSVRDANGMSYIPDPAMIMSYSGKSCRTKFTSKQVQRMKDFINNTPVLANVIYTPTISGSYSCSGISGTFSTAKSDNHAELYVSAGATVDIRFDAIPIKGYLYRWTNGNAYPSLHAGLVGENRGQISIGTSATSGVYSFPITIMPEGTPTFTFVLNVSGRTKYSILYSKDESVIKLSKVNQENSRMVKSNDLKCLIYQIGTGEQVGIYKFSVSDIEKKIDTSTFSKSTYNVVVMEGDNIICSEKFLIN